MSSLPNTKLTGLNGFMLKQTQSANTANTHKHLRGHTLHAHVLKCKEDSLKRCLAYCPHIQTYTFLLSLCIPVLCLILFVPTHTKKTYTHTFVFLNSMTRAFWRPTVKLQRQCADVRIKAGGWNLRLNRSETLSPC